MKIKISFLVLLLSVLYACNKNTDSEVNSHGQELPVLISAENYLPHLPVPITNNAVASINNNGIVEVYSFLGLEKGKTWQDTSRLAFRMRLGKRGFEGAKWVRIKDVPIPQGRLASVAATVNGKIYILGGYSVAEDGSEISQPEVLSFDPKTLEYELMQAIPTPTDDAVAVVYKNRYIYLTSGWHNDDNINLVQVYDTLTNTWQQATPYPGSPVFGHAGGIVNNTMIICDGVKVNYLQTVEEVVEGEKRKREFVMTDECYKGVIDSSNENQIAWQALPKHKSPARYRMASVGEVYTNRVFFLGGSDNPYNYNGMGYNKEASKPVAQPFAYNVETNAWEYYTDLEEPSMDHRGLLIVNGVLVIVGGMDSQQQVTNKVQLYSFPFLEDES